MNTPEEELLTYIAVEPAKAGLIQSTSKSQITSGDIGGSRNLDKVRDLLFGTQIRDFEKKFNRLEERIVKECANLQDDTRKRLETLETYIKHEFDSLSEGLKTEQAERDEAVKNIAQEHKNTSTFLEKKIIQLDEQTNQKQRAIRQQILEQSKSLDDEMRQKYEAILSMFEQEIQEIRTDKTDRSTLAALFSQMAMQLDHEVEIPISE